MQKAKLNVLVAFLAYGGNGNVGMQLPSITMWFAERYLNMHNDDRVGRVVCKTYGDVPLSMERNRIVKDAIEGGFDCILMLDSDNVPDLHLGTRPGAKPFWESSFDFLYERKMQGMPTVVCAPYCGPPPHPVKGGQENVYVFYAEQCENRDEGAPRPAIKFAAYSRDHAAMMTGIQPIAAGPTGVILYSTCALELMPRRVPNSEVLEQYRNGEITLDRALQIIDRQSWFYYEYTDADQSQKASTEDVTNTREIQMAGVLKFGNPVVFCNWDAWAGHYKPKCVGAPAPIPVESVTAAFLEAVRSNVSVSDRMVELDLPPIPAYQGPVLDSAASQAQEPESIPKKAVILGQPFHDPKHTREDAICVSDWLPGEASGPMRILVLGDATGELSWAVVHNRPSATAYRLLKSGYVESSRLELGGSGHGVVRDISESHWHRIASEGQGVDWIVAGTSDVSPQSAIAVAREHLDVRGALYMVGDAIKSMVENLDQSQIARELGVNELHDEGEDGIVSILRENLWVRKASVRVTKSNDDAAV